MSLQTKLGLVLPREDPRIHKIIQELIEEREKAKSSKTLQPKEKKPGWKK